MQIPGDCENADCVVASLPFSSSTSEVMHTTDLTQAVDNAKFLGAAEQYIHAIYLEDPGKMRTPIMRLLYTVKMIFNVSTYFNNSVRISSLLVKITNQIIISCKR